LGSIASFAHVDSSISDNSELPEEHKPLLELLLAFRVLRPDFHKDERVNDGNDSSWEEAILDSGNDIIISNLHDLEETLEEV
jgi:hypothetical protein